ncbi:MAG: GNAT family N-acetyltransferase [Hyphomicrobiaceae bacterium]|nr:GNAT family N-acetyltransferase [Hyphomicrobiaceae bacterium]
MTQSLPLRPFLPADTVALQDLYAQSIEELTQDDYDEDQRLAWIALAADPVAFAKRLMSNTTLVVERDGEVLGFGSLKEGKEIDMLYVHPYAVGEGVASTLLDALEKLAAARGARTLASDVSDTAHDFFQSRGYVPTRRNNIPVEDVWLASTTMSKTLGSGSGTEDAESSKSGGGTS